MIVYRFERDRQTGLPVVVRIVDMEKPQEANPGASGTTLTGRPNPGVQTSRVILVWHKTTAQVKPNSR